MSPSTPLATPVTEEDRAALVALGCLAGLGPGRLRSLVERYGSPSRAYGAVLAGEVTARDLPLGPRGEPAPVREWARSAQAIDPVSLLGRHRRDGVQVLCPGDADWPAVLVGDPEPPRVLFVRGDPGVLARPAVAVVGTRRCTAAGARIATMLGRGLAEAGIVVASGLAKGIDRAAHEGALAGPGSVLGVVATGLDVAYPPQHAQLQGRVAGSGAVISEWPYGSPPERWRFPARNRLLAALAVVVVVVESRARGGSMSTVAEALARHGEVYAVPGSPLVEQSAGTLALIRDGATMVRGPDDVIDALRWLGAVDSSGTRPAATGPGLDHPATADPDQVQVLAALSDVPLGLETLAAGTGLELGSVMAALAALEVVGSVRREPAGYVRRW